MGYAGAHIGGHNITYEMVESIIDKGEELSRNWEALVPEFDYPQKDGFYFFERDAATGLNTDVPAKRTLNPSVPLVYRFSRLAHSLLFDEKSWRFKALRPLAKRVDASPWLRGTVEYMEHLAKVALFGCMNCGDCALFDVAFVCPMSQCPKSQRNGPCGGSYEGWCEVYPNEQKCIWVQAYERLKAYGEESTMGEGFVPPCNWELWRTSSWLNFYLGRDHTSKSLGIRPPEANPVAKGHDETQKSPEAPKTQPSARDV
jgi:methylenetetrahydrofolate reductase (NADPH)